MVIFRLNNVLKNYLVAGLPRTIRGELRRNARMLCETLTPLVKAKFHYTIWFEAGSKLVADQVRAR